MSHAARIVKNALPQRLRQFLKRIRFCFLNMGFVPYIHEVERFGLRFKYYVGDRIGESWCKGGWDWAEIQFLKDHMVQPGDVVLDCGAHHGELTMFFSRWVGESGKVISFDPVPLNAQIIRKNIELNGFTNVRVENKAVGSSTGIMRMTNESNAQVAGRRGSGIDVETVVLDSYVSLRPTFLKIDVEGFESELLKGARQMLSTRPKLAIEIHALSLPRYNTSVKEVFDLFFAEHYDLWVQYPPEQVVRPYNGSSIERTCHLFALPKVSP